MKNIRLYQWLPNLLLSMLLLLNQSLLAQQPDYQKGFAAVDEIFNSYARANHSPGMAYGIIADGKLVFSKVLGMANRKEQYPVTQQSVFRIASMSKSFASVAILQLRDQGKLRLDDTVAQYIPVLRSVNYLTTDAAPITIRHLLTHAAGFPEDNPWGDRQLDISEAEMLEMFSKGISFSTVPGTAYEYSNMGFAMLGYIIRVVSGMPYQQYIQEQIWKPLGMANTYWEYAKVPAKQLAVGYRWLNASWVEQPMEHDGAYGIMGGILTTLEDFARYMNFMLDAWPARSSADEGPLVRSSRREMQQAWNFSALNTNSVSADGKPCAQVAAYGYGLRWSKDCNGKITVGHSGGLPGFGSNWTMLPDYGVGIVSFINETYAPATSLNNKALAQFLSTTGLEPRKLTPSAILVQRQKELTALLPAWKASDTASIFAENFFLDYMIDSLRKQSASLFKQAGKIIRVEEMQPINNLRGRYRIVGEKRSISIFFTLSPELPAKIQALDMELED